MSEAFIDRARTRLMDAVTRAKAGTLRGDDVIALIAVVESAVTAVDEDGCLPSHLCTAVVKYGAAK